MDTKTFSLFDDLNSTIGLNKITNKKISNKTVPWNFVDFVHHHTDRNVDMATTHIRHLKAIKR